MRFCTRLLWQLSLLLLLGGGGVRAQEAQPSEYQLKAAFLFHFAKFIEWPAEAFKESSSPIVIGVLGESPFGGDLEKTIRGKSLNNHPLAIREYRSAGEATNCHVLFISTSERQRLPEILNTLRQASVLTVGEMDRFTEAGGMISFVMEGGKIRFQINDAAAKGVGLRISSKLLSLALRPAR